VRRAGGRDIPMVDAVFQTRAILMGQRVSATINIVPPMAAIANAIDSVIHRRLTELPITPPRIRAALDHAGVDDSRGHQAVVSTSLMAGLDPRLSGTVFAHRNAS
jgi:hypothetical protein